MVQSARLMSQLWSCSHVVTILILLHLISLLLYLFSPSFCGFSSILLPPLLLLLQVRLWPSLNPFLSPTLPPAGDHVFSPLLFLLLATKSFPHSSSSSSSLVSLSSFSKSSRPSKHAVTSTLVTWQIPLRYKWQLRL